MPLDKFRFWGMGGGDSQRILSATPSTPGGTVAEPARKGTLAHVKLGRGQEEPCAASHSTASSSATEPRDGRHGSLDNLFEDSDSSCRHSSGDAEPGEDVEVQTLPMADSPMRRAHSMPSPPRWKSPRPGLGRFQTVSGLRSDLREIADELQEYSAGVWAEPPQAGGLSAFPPRSCRERACVMNEVQKRRSGYIETLTSLRRVAGLGAGQFGCVSLVADANGTPHALKALWKGQLVSSGQVEAVARERALLGSIDHPSVVRLEAAFQDERRLYLLMEPVLGGELFAILHVVGRLDQPAARFYTASVADVLAHLHEVCGVVYRDLKPENLLLDARGYLKLVDFGLAKRLRPPHEPGGTGTGSVAPTEPARTICGTPEYLAPEMVRGDAYGFSVDWWALGMLLFEMLSGVPAFRGETSADVYYKILHAEPRLLVPVEPECGALLAGLLAKRVDDRMGDAGSVRACSFFDGFDWAAHAERSLSAPYRPKIAHQLDTSNVVLSRETYASPASEADGGSWDRYLTMALLKHGTNPFAGFSRGSQAWCIDGVPIGGKGVPIAERASLSAEGGGSLPASGVSRRRSSNRVSQA
eukprot:scaffold35232_cov90-Isochrysis_galbana.AAC.1